MELATNKQIAFLQKLGALFNSETITKKEASILIGRTIKANKQQETNTDTRKETTKKDNEPRQEKTLQQLLAEYNCGTTEDSEGRFYKGNNAHNLPSYYKDASEWLKAIKKIILKEFNIKILASKSMATYTPSYKFTIKTTPQEIFKSYEELKAEGVLNSDILKEFQNYNGLFRSVFMNWEPVGKIAEIVNDDETVKNFYNWVNEYRSEIQSMQYRTDRTDCQNIKEVYLNMVKFLGAFMTSYNSDHTGAFMGDCDYVDCSFFYSIDWENQHDLIIQSKQIKELYDKDWREYQNRYGDKLSKLSNNIFNATTKEQLNEYIKEYTGTKASFLKVEASNE